MSKSRKRRFGFSSQSPGGAHSHRKTRGVSGDPGKRPVAPSPQQTERLALSTTLLRKAASMPLADPIAFGALPAVTMHALRTREAAGPVIPGSGGTFATADCVTECLTLAYAYAELGIEAQVRAAELTVTDGKTGAEARHGVPRPRWEDGRFFGHTVLWLPEHRHLIDPAAERYQEIAAWKAGPVIAAAPPRDSVDSDDEKISLTVTRGFLRLGYVLGSREVTDAVLGDPAAQPARDTTRVRGVNVASEVVWLLASARTAAETRLIPYQRASALVDAARGMDRHGDTGEDVFFTPRGEPGAGSIRIHQISLPDGTPGPVAVV